ncbi:penicillin-binding transpeptidase domain-containing protein [Tateyamaria sp. SN3-11]|uniref:penicillin-binding transpeptidase domain-containing protein n=1 Tax=Tateyamaria sp. SN3-11 TaxID=3092147 RepID=UPI0039ECCCB4
MALETGTAQADTLFKWEGQPTWNEDWKRDHTLQSAFRNSVVWIYQDIVQQVGAPGMEAWLQRLDYGNATTGGPDTLTTYWLNDTLQISAVEQVDFLTRLVEQRLPISPETYAAADDIMLADTGEGWELRAKTGWRHGRDIMDIGWYVGWVACGDDHYVFALNMDMPDSSFRDFRQSTAMSVLTDIGAFNCN